jgi:glycosyltransferase involved in cell wall biosynthesis
MLNGSLPSRALWQRFRLSSDARAAACDVLLVPGGTFAGDFHPTVAISQNLLPFQLPELRRYGCSLLAMKLRLLRVTQSHTLRSADGVLFLSAYARATVLREIGGTVKTSAIVPHGVPGRFFQPPREQEPIERYSSDRPFRIVYVSIVDVYKHQWHVVEAVASLRQRGLPVALELSGPAYPPALARLLAVMDRADGQREFITYSGAAPYAEVHRRYATADMLVFASSCENLPIILLEGMASGLPIVCSNRGPMPEVLGDAGVYCNPEDPQDIARAVSEMVRSPGLRAAKATAAYEQARQFSWQRCADQTFAFLAQVSRQPAASAA